MKVFILGYSKNPQRYSHMAYNLLQEKGHEAIKINPNEVESYPDLESAAWEMGTPHTLTIYVKKEISNFLIKDILRLNPQRVIFNPGSENQNLKKALIERDIEVVEGCTLVMLNTRQF